MSDKSAAQRFIELASKGKVYRTSLNLDAKLHQEFKKLCQKRGVTMSDLLDVMIRDLVNNLKTKEKSAARERDADKADS